MMAMKFSRSASYTSFTVGQDENDPNFVTESEWNQHVSEHPKVVFSRSHSDPNRHYISTDQELHADNDYNNHQHFSYNQPQERCSSNQVALPHIDTSTQHFSFFATNVHNDFGGDNSASHLLKATPTSPCRPPASRPPLAHINPVVTPPRPAQAYHHRILPIQLTVDTQGGTNDAFVSDPVMDRKAEMLALHCFERLQPDDMDYEDEDEYEEVEEEGLIEDDRDQLEDRSGRSGPTSLDREITHVNASAEPKIMPPPPPRADRPLNPVAALFHLIDEEEYEQQQHMGLSDYYAIAVEDSISPVSDITLSPRFDALIELNEEETWPPLRARTNTVFTFDLEGEEVAGITEIPRRRVSTA